jgi:hypothetical protein
MSHQRCANEFKDEVVRQVTKKSHSGEENREVSTFR